MEQLDGAENERENTKNKQLCTSHRAKKHRKKGPQEE